MKDEFCKLAVIGGGPIGLFTAIKLAELGHEVDLFEKGTWPRDKVCGQGIMPSGQKCLEEIGIVFELGVDSQSFDSIKYIDGKRVLTGFMPSSGLGVERQVLSEKLFDRAKLDKRIHLKSNTTVDFVELLTTKKIKIKTLNDEFVYDYIFACDGLNSTIRKLLNFEKSRTSELRLGARQHFNQKPWNQSVEVYWANQLEAYVTPVNDHKIEVAFLWFENRIEKGAKLFKRLLLEFPDLKQKLDLSQSAGDFAAYGPFKKIALDIRKGNVFFIGDAYHFMDGITGEGISLGFKSASHISSYFHSFDFKHSLKIKIIYLNYRVWVRLALLLTKFPSLRSTLMRILGPKSKFFNFILKLNDLS